MTEGIFILTNVGQDSILNTGKNGYDVAFGFTLRTQKVIANEGHPLRERDLVAYPDDHPLVVWLAGLVTPGSRVLEFGCGYGRLAPVVAPPASVYHGVDIIAARIDWAVQKYTGLGHPGVSFELIPEDWMGSSQMFDCALSITVLQHMMLGRAVASLKAIYDSLVPGGRLLMWEARIHALPLAEVEQLYSDAGHEEHMIPKPINLLREAAPFRWAQDEIEPARFILTK